MESIPQTELEINKGPKVIALATLLHVIVSIIVGLRIWVKVHRRLSMSLDDWLILSSFVSGNLTNKQKDSIFSILVRSRC